MPLLFLFVVALPVSAWISLALHESAHAMIGRLMGMQIAEIRLGTGPEIFRSRLRGAEIRIGLVPLGGYVRIFPPLFYRRSAMASFYAAGPAMDLAWFLALIALYAALRGSPIASAVVLLALIYQAVMLLRNLVPHVVHLYGERIPNDMLSLWRTLWTERDANRLYRETYLGVLRQYQDKTEPTWCPSGRSDRIAYHLHDSILAVAPRPLTDEAVEALDRELPRTGARSERLLILDTIVTNVIAQPGSRHERQLDRWTSDAMALRPDLATLKGSRGAALVRLGRYEEALAMLAQADSSNDVNRCLNATFQAMAYFRSGRHDLAFAAQDVALAALRSLPREGWIGGTIIADIGSEIGHGVSQEGDGEAIGQMGDAGR
ncbi:site-2 protease family protein [Bosea sp. 685]|uniref:site-2 protease family protein n=1 Tax=Bosea sp. 685 TaxID=3080057 RepID=UPI0028933B9A|nr:site-2 protease family protein [Bosea sp. 685]WNJ89893.1 site-2 protease family protein [Bosea sp. 685]